MKTILKSVFVIAALAGTALADKPNFSGDWTMDVDKSNFGPAPPPASMTRKVEHTDPALTVTTTQSGGQQDGTSTMKYTTDGKENTNEMMGNPVKSTLKWDGDHLVISSKADFGGQEINLTDTWSLSTDGKVLTDVLHLALPQGEFDITIVMNKK
jgi:hypothetical protein